MGHVRIVTDSTADLSEKVRNRYGIIMVPLNVHFGDVRYLDQINISPTDFYRKLELADELPRTSQPSPGDFVDAYKKLSNDPDTDGIISIHLSSELSGTYQSAVIAAGIMAEDGINVDVIDSRMACIQMGATVIGAAKAAQEGRTRTEILALIEKAIKTIPVLFVVDTLEYLQKNGRIGRAAGWLGGLLKIKPILTVTDGAVMPVEKVRGEARAIPRLAQIAAGYADGDTPQTVCVAYANCRDSAVSLIDVLKKQINITDVSFSEIGPVIGSHVGPGTVAVSLHNSDLFD